MIKGSIYQQEKKFFIKISYNYYKNTVKILASFSTTCWIKLFRYNFIPFKTEEENLNFKIKIKTALNPIVLCHNSII